MGLQRVGHNWVTEQQQQCCIYFILISNTKPFLQLTWLSFQKHFHQNTPSVLEITTDLRAQELKKNPSGKLLFTGIEEGESNLCCTLGKYLSCFCVRTCNYASDFSLNYFKIISTLTKLSRIAVVPSPCTILLKPIR